VPVRAFSSITHCARPGPSGTVVDVAVVDVAVVDVAVAGAVAREVVVWEAGAASARDPPGRA
jgi:hypothetical protein